MVFHLVISSSSGSFGSRSSAISLTTSLYFHLASYFNVSLSFLNLFIYNNLKYSDFSPASTATLRFNYFFTFSPSLFSLCIFYSTSRKILRLLYFFSFSFSFSNYIFSFSIGFICLRNHSYLFYALLITSRFWNFLFNTKNL